MRKPEPAFASSAAEDAWELSDPWPGMLMRRAVVKDGKVVSEKFQRVPLDKDLWAALEWAEREYRR